MLNLSGTSQQTAQLAFDMVCDINKAENKFPIKPEAIRFSTNDVSLSDTLQVLTDFCNIVCRITLGHFIAEMYCVLAQLLEKKNCLHIVAPRNYGKTVIVQNILKVLIPNWGEFSGGNRFFAAEEIVLTDESKANLKRVIGGERCSVERKALPNYWLNRTPVQFVQYLQNDHQ